MEKVKIDINNFIVKVEDLIKSKDISKDIEKKDMIINKDKFIEIKDKKEDIIKEVEVIKGEMFGNVIMYIVKNMDKMILLFSVIGDFWIGVFDVNGSII